MEFVGMFMMQLWTKFY